MQAQIVKTCQCNRVAATVLLVAVGAWAGGGFMEHTPKVDSSSIS